MALDKFTCGCQSPEGYPYSRWPSDGTKHVQLLLRKVDFGKPKSNGVRNCKRVTNFYCSRWINNSWEFSCVEYMSDRWFSQNLSARDRHWWVASSQELLGSYTSDREVFCCRLVTVDKTWIYHILGPIRQIRIHAVEVRGLPQIYGNLQLSH